MSIKDWRIAIDYRVFHTLIHNKRFLMVKVYG